MTEYISATQLLTGTFLSNQVQYARISTSEWEEDGDQSEDSQIREPDRTTKNCLILILVLLCSSTIFGGLSYAIYDRKVQSRIDSPKFKISSMLPMDDYTKDVKVSKMSKCDMDSPRIMNNRLWHLKDLDTPCSLKLERCVIALSLWCKKKTNREHCEQYLSESRHLPKMKELYVGWEIWLYTDGSIPSELLESGMFDMVKVVIVPKSYHGTGSWGMMWRLLPIWERTVDRFITRDIDEVPMIRAWSTTYEWIRQNHSALRWADHRLHKGYKWPIMGGTLGLTRWAFTDKQRDELWLKWNNSTHNYHWADDQKWYKKHIWPVIKQDILSFDPFYCEIFDISQPYPIPHSHCDYTMGASDDMFGHRHECKTKCQHKGHKDWIWG